MINNFWKKSALFLLLVAMGFFILTFIKLPLEFFVWVLARILRIESLGNFFFINGKALILTNYCSGLALVWVFLALFFSGLIKWNWKKIAFGIIVILIYNFLRVLFVLLAAKSSIVLAQNLHVLSWFLALLLVLWLALLENLKISKSFFNLD